MSLTFNFDIHPNFCYLSIHHVQTFTLGAQTIDNLFSCFSFKDADEEETSSVYSAAGNNVGGVNKQLSSATNDCVADDVAEFSSEIGPGTMQKDLPKKQMSSHVCSSAENTKENDRNDFGIMNIYNEESRQEIREEVC